MERELEFRLEFEARWSCRGAVSEQLRRFARPWKLRRIGSLERSWLKLAAASLSLALKEIIALMSLLHHPSSQG